MKIFGTHGTTVAKAEKIEEKGFELKPGRRGTGAYFWRQGKYSRLLAIAWWDQSKKKGLYSGDHNIRCAILHAEFNIKENQYLFLSVERKEKVAQIAISKSIDIKNKKRISDLFDMVIREWEKEKKTTFKVIESAVSPPNSEYCRKKFPKIIVGDPHCYLARTNDCIGITLIEKGASL